MLTPTDDRYTDSDARVIEAIARFRAGGYDERIGFTVYDTLRYKRALEQLVEEEVEVLMGRLAGEMATDDAVALIERRRRAATRADRSAAFEAAACRAAPQSRSAG